MVEDQRTSNRSARRVRNRLRTRRRLLALVAVGTVVGGTAWALGQGERPTVVRAAPTTTTTATTATIPVELPPAAVIATTNGGEVPVFEAPDESSKRLATLPEISHYGFPRTLLAIEQQPGWVHALLPVKPNGSSGWVRESDVTLSTTTYAITISLSRHELVFTNNGEVVVTAPTVIGRPNTPTPLGTFYVTDRIDLTKRPSKVYGVFALGVSGYSEVLGTFNGGPAQVAVHGTPSLTDFGTDISNGCVRVANDVILQIAEQVPLGTPVTIAA